LQKALSESYYDALHCNIGNTGVVILRVRRLPSVVSISNHGPLLMRRIAVDKPFWKLGFNVSCKIVAVDPA